LHYGWKTTAEYRRRFGHLDYMWRVDLDEPFARDAAPPLRLPAEILTAARFTLFPFASSDFNAPAACAWGIHDEGFGRLRAGDPHPVGDRVLAWYDSRAMLEELWSGLSDADREVALRAEETPEEGGTDSLSASVVAYLRATGLADAVYAGLQRAEEAKVLGAIGGLADVLLRWRASERGGS
jgi:hypothetical protein